jgi:hypothetical protein
MNRNFALSAAIAAFTLVGCDSGDIVLAPGSGTGGNDNGNGGNGGGGTTNPCALYESSGQTFQGTVDSNGNCFYSSQFVSDTRPITVDQIVFPNFGGFHIFQDSLFIGEDVNATAAAAGKRIPQEGEGTQLVIEAGNTMVFNEPDSYVRIARGSQIFAEGTAEDPIVFTAEEDAVQGVATESDRGLWGGIQINGNGRTNKCHDGTVTGAAQDAGVPSQFSPTANNVHSCNITSEGRPATYGGNNNEENSGVLTYVIVKHAGFEVVLDNELNAFTFNAVGSGTTAHHLQAYTSQDDGFETFGGAVSLHHIVGVNVGDDALDFSEGWQGDVQYAVLLATSGANNCIEADNTGADLPDSLTPYTKGRISNLTCITSNVDRDIPQDQPQASNPSSKGDSEGWLFREGVFFEIYNSIVTSYAADMASNECFEIDDTEGPDTIDAAERNNSADIATVGSDPTASYARSNIIACSEALKQGIDAANAGFDLGAWLAGGSGTNANANNFVFTGADIPLASLIQDLGTGTRAYLTADTLTDALGGEIAIEAHDVTSLPDGDFFGAPTYIGGAATGDNWLEGWTVGLDLPLTPTL